MTTNQTIDGVPRGLLRWLDDFINDGLELSKEEASISARLRALLDADKVNNRQMGLMQFVDAHPIKPAGQPQREPAKPYGYMFYPDGKKDEEFFIYEAPRERLPDHRGDYWTAIPLYAEQRAPVTVVMSFDFEHPSSKERRTVALSKQDVFDGMEDYFYDKIGEQICRCESVGETNVVDCSCDEYVHDFEIVKASLTS